MPREQNNSVLVSTNKQKCIDGNNTTQKGITSSNSTRVQCSLQNKTTLKVSRVNCIQAEWVGGWEGGVKWVGEQVQQVCIHYTLSAQYFLKV